MREISRQPAMQGIGSRESGMARRIWHAASAALMGFAGAQALRLLANLALTRLLVPEAFGLMTVITLLLMGLKLFSDIGIGQSVLRSPRGDDPVFLDTVWSLELLRGCGLWLLTLALAWPLAAFYDAPALLALVPVTGLVLILGGLEPTKVDTAARHLLLGRITAYELISQALGLALTIALAFVTGSVWALAIGQVLAAGLRLGFMLFGLPGRQNRFRIERESLGELVGFGKWLFLSTIAGFAMAQGDKLVLSTQLSLEALGIYNIGYFLAAVPLMLGAALTGRLMIPLYRDMPPAQSPEGFARLARIRAALTCALLGLSAVLAIAGLWLVGLLYDPRYAMAGPVLIVTALALMPQIAWQSYDQAALAAGDSRGFCALALIRGALFLAVIFAGASLAGLPGAIAGQALAGLLAWPFVIGLARRHGAWDPRHDLLALLAMGAITAFVLTLHISAISTL